MTTNGGGALRAQLLPPRRDAAAISSVSPPHHGGLARDRGEEALMQDAESTDEGDEEDMLSNGAEEAGGELDADTLRLAMALANAPDEVREALAALVGADEKREGR